MRRRGSDLVQSVIPARKAVEDIGHHARRYALTCVSHVNQDVITGRARYFLNDDSNDSSPGGELERI